MKLETLTKPELVEKAKILQIPDAEALNKTDLLKKLQAVLEANPTLWEKIDPPVVKKEPVFLKPLTQAEKRWKDYLEAIHSTPEAFLARFPNHQFKAIIEKLK